MPASIDDLEVRGSLATLFELHERQLWWAECDEHRQLLPSSGAVSSLFGVPVLRFSLFVRAPIDRVFDLARSVELHLDTTDGTDEEVVAGRTSGLMELADEVTWEATHLFVRQRLTARITEFDRPHRFRDTMVKGAFRRFDHDHIFTAKDDGTLLEDVFDYEAPLGLLGDAAEWLFLNRYMHGFLRRRSMELKQIAESELWKKYLPEVYLQSSS